MDDTDLLAKLAEDEARLVFDRFSNSMAWALGTSLVEHGHANNLPIAIDITRHGQCLFHCALDGAVPDNAEWIKRKNRVVNRFGHSSLYMGVSFRLDGRTIEESKLLPESEFAPHGGAFPILIRDTGPIGTATVSGLPQLDDHNLVVTKLSELLHSS